MTDKGVPAKIGWGSNGEIAKAIQALEADGDLEKISPLMGGMHKVRNFYNNIIAPNSAHGDVTIDTHAVGAGLLRSVSQMTPEVGQNFASAPEKAKYAKLRAARPDLNLPEQFAGARGSSISGLQGTYPLYAEATRRAAKERGILPREMQSITWEGIRSLFPDSWKSHANNAIIDNIWRKHERGEISIDDARRAILKAAGAEEGIPPPSWWKGPSRRPGP